MKTLLMHTLMTVSMLCLAETLQARGDSISISKLIITTTPSALLDGWDGIGPRIGLAYRVEKDVAVTLDGEMYFRHQPVWAIRHDIHGFEIRPGVKGYGLLQRRYHKRTHTAYSTGYRSRYIGAELLIKHQVFRYHDSIRLGNDPAYDKWYTIKRFAAGLTVLYGEETGFGLFTFDFYVGCGIRYKYSTCDLTQSEKDGRLTGEGHGDLIGDAERSLGHSFRPVLLLGVKLGLQLIR